MTNKQKMILIMIITATITCLIIGSTFAYWSWSTSNAQTTTITFTTSSGFSCSADGGGNISSSSIQLMPAACTNSNSAIKRTITTSITNNGSTPVYMDLWLNVVSIGSGLSESNNFKYALTTDSTSCTNNVQASGTFKGKTNGSEVNLLDNVTSGSTYYLYIWLDAAETSDTTMNQSFNFTLGGECNNAEPNAPVLDDGLIPVKIAENGTVTTVSTSDPAWYNYQNKEWANAVLVKETGVKTRTQNKVVGTTINTDDIIAYYVWIPRYSYKIWTVDASTDHKGEEQTINIKFVDKNTKETASSVGDWYTHPAFTFGTEELSGFWVGKFETSADTSSECYTRHGASVGGNGGTCNTTGIPLRIVPGVDPIRIQKVGYQYLNAMEFSGGTMNSSTYITTYAGSSTYGLTANTDAHMMKNSEWGAALYLAYSKYGIDGVIRKNNVVISSTQTMTGCGANPASITYEDDGYIDRIHTSSTCYIEYGTPSNEENTYPQSTTGNISGIFDMSGGASERVMAHHAKNGDSYGFDAAWFTTPENSKYYDLYDSDIFTGGSLSNFTFCTISTCGGHGLYETRGWYGSRNQFAYGSKPWFDRGRTAGLETSNGAASSTYSTGAASADGDDVNKYFGHGWRSVLVTR